MTSIHFCWPEGKAGAFTASYDDGPPEDPLLIEIFNRYGMRGTWNLNGNRSIPNPTPGVDKKLQALYTGHEVAAHSLTHPCLERLPDERILMEMMEDRRRLEGAIGYPVKGMALPYGSYDQRVLGILAQAGIVHCRTVKSTMSFGVPENFLEWHPTCHHQADLPKLWQDFTNRKEPHKLFYLWGHSYEFDRNNNWDIIEAFGALVKAALESGWLWSATNMEIYDYVTAWRKLWCSLDGSSVRNTCGTSLWVKTGNNVVKIGAGETLVVTE
jgi:hypothetical protein